MYKVWEEVPTLLFHLRSKKHRQVVACFIGGSLLGADVECITPDAAAEDWFTTTCLRGNNLQDLQEEMRSICLSLKLGSRADLDNGTTAWDGVLDDLVQLSLRPSDLPLDQIGSGELHRFLYYNVDPIPVMNLIVELSFSCLKTTEMTNAGAETTNMSMATKMQVFHPARVERIGMETKKGNLYKSPQQLDTFRQYLHWADRTGRDFGPR